MSDCAYCLICDKGIIARNNFLKNSESVFDAVSDFELFVKNCAKTCEFVRYEKERTADNNL
jgi:hypothetical protein